MDEQFKLSVDESESVRVSFSKSMYLTMFIVSFNPRRYKINDGGAPVDH